MFGLSEVAVILVVVMAVVAAKKLPDLARSAGRSTRILKAEARAIEDDETGPPPRVIRGESAARPDAAPGATEPGGGP
ncbi:twin-arginine translocase TatA/TatE family subunit [Streptomyces ossamyceticus]|nr:twin-arginine translocase TatA/TatE family subunit [Streptomyces ossamyceticus]